MATSELHVSAHDVSQTFSYPSPEIVEALHRCLVEFFNRGSRYVDLIHQTGDGTVTTSIPTGALMTSATPSDIDLDGVIDCAITMTRSFEHSGGIKFDVHGYPCWEGAADSDADSSVDI